MALTDHFAISIASLVGREHVRLHRNNQDGAAVVRRPDVIAAVVADGCGEGASTEVGARLTSVFLANWLAANAPRLEDNETLSSDATRALTDWLGALAAPFGAAEGHAAFVRDFLLCTFLAVVLTRNRALVFGIGDGVVCVNGGVRRLDPGPDNAPAYAAYALVDPGALVSPPSCAAPVLHHSAPLEQFESVLIATDGLAEIEEELPGLASDAGFARNPTLLQRRLVVLGSNQRRIRDDATAVLIQRVQLHGAANEEAR